MFRFLNIDGMIALHDVLATTIEFVPAIVTMIGLPEAHPVFGVFAKQRVYHRITIPITAFTGAHGPDETLFVEGETFMAAVMLADLYLHRVLS